MVFPLAHISSFETCFLQFFMSTLDSTRYPKPGSLNTKNYHILASHGYWTRTRTPSKNVKCFVFFQFGAKNLKWNIQTSTQLSQLCSHLLVPEVFPKSRAHAQTLETTLPSVSWMLPKDVTPISWRYPRSMVFSFCRVYTWQTLNQNATKACTSTFENCCLPKTSRVEIYYTNLGWPHHFGGDY